MHDRNKTELTQNITRLAALWLDGKGFKPVETEVGVDDQWVADVAGVCFPTQTELIELKLLRRGPRYRSFFNNPSPEEQGKYEVVCHAWNAERDALPNRLTAVIEVKTSVGDFRGDKKWERPWPTNLCYVAMPEGMIEASEWPKDWGVLLFSQEGTTIRKTFPSKMRLATIEQHLDVIVSLAVARDHKTRYERLRTLQKEIRITQGERKTLARVHDAILFVRKLMEGKSIEEAKSLCGIKCDLPEYLVEELQTLIPKKPVFSSNVLLAQIQNDYGTINSNHISPLDALGS